MRGEDMSRPNGANFWRGVRCIAYNDEPTVMDVQQMEGFCSVHAIAAAFNCTTEYVAVRVVKLREKEVAE